MAKYIDADLLRKRIKKNKFVIELMFAEGDGSYYEGENDGYDRVLDIIDSLQQEQPEVDLKKEIDACWQNWLSPSNQKEVEGVLPKTEFEMYARHFAEWGAIHLNARKEE